MDETRAPTRVRQRTGIRTAVPEDAPEIHRLLCAAFPSVPRDFDAWHRRWIWQYWESPWRRERPTGWVWQEGTRILGHLGAVYLPFRRGLDLSTAMVGADFAVTDEAAKFGRPLAGLELAERFFRHTDNVVPMANTANAQTQAVFSRYGCRPVAWTKEFWRASTTLSQQIRTFRGVGNRLARRILSGLSGAITQPLAEQGYSLLNHQPQVPVPHGLMLESLPINRARLLLKCYENLTPREDELGVYHTRMWFEWRYLHDPDPESLHAILLRRADGSIAAWCIIGSRAMEESTYASILEMHVPPDQERWRLTLLCAALKAASEIRADYLVTQTGRQEWRDLFWALGFESRARSAPAVTMQPTEKANADQLASALTFWHGDMF